MTRIEDRYFTVFVCVSDFLGNEIVKQQVNLFNKDQDIENVFQLETAIRIMKELVAKSERIKL